MIQDNGGAKENHKQTEVIDPAVLEDVFRIDDYMVTNSVEEQNNNNNVPLLNYHHEMSVNAPQVPQQYHQQISSVYQWHQSKYNNFSGSENVTQLINNACSINRDYVTKTELMDAKEEDNTAAADMGNTSDGSTVENTSIDDAAGETPDNLTDGPYTYLQGLNSDNLMQFSQQSALQELMLKEQMDIKPFLFLQRLLQQANTLPTLENHDCGGYNFQMNIPKQSKGNWVYSEPLNKIYIRMNQLFNVEVAFKPKLPIQMLQMRAFLCFVKEVSEPVLRCQNHISKDEVRSENMRHSLLRCENPSTQYCGTDEGKSINDRLSVVVPLNVCSALQDDNTIKQTIAFKFTCQNSCIGRKETTLVFILEGMNGEILGQRVLDVKICSCPKRDKVMDERNLNCGSSHKRKSNDDGHTGEAKVRKSHHQQQQMIYKDDSRSDFNDFNDTDSNSSTYEYDIQQQSSGAFRLVVDCSSLSMVQQHLEGMYKNVSTLVLEQYPQHSLLLDKEYKGLRSLKKKLGRFK